jgi:hypothetical protein
MRVEPHQETAPPCADSWIKRPRDTLENRNAGTTQQTDFTFFSPYFSGTSKVNEILQAQPRVLLDYIKDHEKVAGLCSPTRGERRIFAPDSDDLLQ